MVVVWCSEVAVDGLVIDRGGTVVVVADFAATGAGFCSCFCFFCYCFCWLLLLLLTAAYCYC